VMISFRPTAVYFERTWKIMTVVIMRAAMWMKSVAVWKMSVFASWTFRA